MRRKEGGALTEPMFYILMAFLHRGMCGTEVMAFVSAASGGRVTVGPGTLYTILGKFEEERLIEETAVEGRKRTYRITERGRAAYHEELGRLRACIGDAAKAGETQRTRPARCTT